MRACGVCLSGSGFPLGMIFSSSIPTAKVTKVCKGAWVPYFRCLLVGVHLGSFHFLALVKRETVSMAEQCVEQDVCPLGECAKEWCASTTR